MLSEPEVVLEREDHVAILTLNAPARLNALSSETHRLLGEIWDELAADAKIRAVILTGAGRAFCAGAEAGMLNGLSGTADQPPMPKFTARQKCFYKPVIVAVNGVCAGAGFHFVNDSDIIIASERAYFVDTHVNMGHVASLEPVGLLRRIPLERVLRMVILGRKERVDAQTALDIGLVSELVPHERLMPRARELAAVAASGSPATMQLSLQAIWESFEYTLQEAYDRGYEILTQHRLTHPDAAEGPLAFIEKREPFWTD